MGTWEAPGQIRGWEGCQLFKAARPPAASVCRTPQATADGRVGRNTARPPRPPHRHDCTRRGGAHALLRLADREDVHVEPGLEGWLAGLTFAGTLLVAGGPAQWPLGHLPLGGVRGGEAHGQAGQQRVRKPDPRGSHAASVASLAIMKRRALRENMPILGLGGWRAFRGGEASSGTARIGSAATLCNAFRLRFCRPPPLIAGKRPPGQSARERPTHQKGRLDARPYLGAAAMKAPTRVTKRNAMMNQ